MILDVDIISELEDRDMYGKMAGTEKWKCLCPFPDHNEINPSMVVSVRDDESRGLFYCYGCHEQGNFFQLVAMLDGVPISEVKAKYGIDSYSTTALEKAFISLLRGSSKRRKKYKRVSVELYHELPKPSGKYLSYLTCPKRKLTLESIENFDLRIQEDGKYRNRVWLPYYDMKGGIPTMKARSIKPDIPKDYKTLTKKGTKPQACLFGLTQLFKKFGKIDKIVVVEGEFDAIYLQQNNVPAVATGTTRFSSSQLKEFLEWFDIAYMAYDDDMKDTEEKRGIIEATTKRLKKYVPVVWLDMPKGKDPNEMTLEEINEYFLEFKVDKT